MIDAVASDRQRPLWSVMIPTYNCASYLRDTLQSVLAFRASATELQVEVIDDRSTADDPEAVVRAFGDPRVAFHQQPHNVGAIRNFNTCLERSRGELVHILHGDDFVQEGFYERVGSAFTNWPEVAAVFTRCFEVDADGELDSLSPRLQRCEGGPTNDASWMYYNDPIRTPGVVVRRAFYERHGGFLPELIHTADWEMWVRATSRESTIALNEPLASYRMFGENHTSQLLRSGEIWRDHLRFADVCASEKLPGFDQQRFRDVVASEALSTSRSFAELGDEDAMNANRKAWKEVRATDAQDPRGTARSRPDTSRLRIGQLLVRHARSRIRSAHVMACSMA